METAAALDGFAGFGGPAEPTDGDETFKQVDEVAQRLGMEVRAPCEDSGSMWGAGRGVYVGAIHTRIA